MVANVQNRGDRRLHADARHEGCRYVRDVWSNQPLAGNQCVDEVTLDLSPWSGRPLAYSTTAVAP